MRLPTVFRKPAPQPEPTGTELLVREWQRLELLIEGGYGDGQGGCIAERAKRMEDYREQRDDVERQLFLHILGSPTVEPKR